MTASIHRSPDWATQASTTSMQAERAAHTPGRWKCEPWSAKEAQVVASRNGVRTLICAGLLPADAQLTSAGPDLLSAGEALAQVADDKLATVRETVEAVRVMRAAIAKARGEA